MSESHRLDKLRQQAESQMRREAPDVGPNKRSKTNHHNEVGRFKYAAVQQLQTGAKGFILTCGFKREKSATKEALQLLQPYLPNSLFGDSPGGADGGVEFVLPEIEADTTVSEEAKNEAAVAAAPPPIGVHPSSLDGAAGSSAGLGQVLSMIKLSCQGVVMIVLPADAALLVDPADVVRRVMRDVASGTVPPPKFCQRMQPMQATCAFAPAAVKEAARLLGAAFAAKRIAAQRTEEKKDLLGEEEEKGGSEEKREAEKSDASLAVSYAVGFKTRASGSDDETTSKPKPNGAAPPAANAEAEAEAAGGASGRREAVVAVAAGFNEALEAAGLVPRVDLNAPEVAVLCDVFPVGRLLVAGLCILEDRDTFSSKPKLLIKPLAAVPQAGGKQGSGNGKGNGKGKDKGCK